MAAQERKTSRPLLFDDEARLRGRGGSVELAGMHSRAFSGIHVISPAIFSKLSEDGVFSIIDAYLRLSGQGERIVGFRADEYKWRDLGRPEHVAEAAQELW